jgi:small subunit ribosomal protein S15
MNILIHTNETIKNFQIHEKDCGSVFVQCAILTERISNLTEHLKAHKHDFNSRRSLLIMVNKRKKMLKYLFSKNQNMYYDLIAKLNIRDTFKK